MLLRALLRVLLRMLPHVQLRVVWHGALWFAR
jgi:hypothetical protein